MDKWQVSALRFLCEKNHDFQGRNPRLLARSGKEVVTLYSKSGNEKWKDLAQETTLLFASYSAAKYSSYPWTPEEREKLDAYSANSKLLAKKYRQCGIEEAALVLETIELDLRSPMPLAIYRLQMNGRFNAMAKAVGLCHKAIGKLEKLRELLPKDDLIIWCKAYFEEKQAEAHYFLREYDKARNLFGKSLQNRDKYVGAVAKYSPHLKLFGQAYLVESHLNIASVARETHADGALVEVERAEKLFRKIPEEHRYRVDQLLAYMLRTKASVLRGIGEFYKAEGECRKALKIYIRLHRQSPSPRFRSPNISEEDLRIRLGYELAVTHITLGGILSRQKRWEAARLYCELALGNHFLLPAMVRRTNPQQKMRLLHHLGKIHLNLAREQRTAAYDASRTLEHLLQRHELKLHQIDEDALSIRPELRQVIELRNQHEEEERIFLAAALSYFTAERALYEELDKEPAKAYSRDHAKSIVRYGDVLKAIYIRNGQPARINKCVAAYEEALEILRRAVGPDNLSVGGGKHDMRPEIMLDIASIHCKIGQIYESLPDKNSFSLAVEHYTKCTETCVLGLRALQNNNRDFAREKRKFEDAYRCQALVEAKRFLSSNSETEKNLAFDDLITLLETLRHEGHIVSRGSQSVNTVHQTEENQFKNLWRGWYNGKPSSGIESKMPEGNLAQLIENAREQAGEKPDPEGKPSTAMLYIQNLSKGRVLFVLLGIGIREVAITDAVPNASTELDTESLSSSHNESARHEDDLKVIDLDTVELREKFDVDFGILSLLAEFQDTIKAEEAQLLLQPAEDKIQLSGAEIDAFRKLLDGILGSKDADLQSSNATELNRLRRELLVAFPEVIFNALTSGQLTTVFVSACTKWMNIPFSLLTFEEQLTVLPSSLLTFEEEPTVLPLGIQMIFPRVHGLLELQSVLSRFPSDSTIFVSDFAPLEQNGPRATRSFESYLPSGDVNSIEEPDVKLIMESLQSCGLWYHVGHSCPPLRDRHCDGLILNSEVILTHTDINAYNGVNSLGKHPIVHLDACEAARSYQPIGGGRYTSLCHSAIRAGASAVVSNSHLVRLEHVYLVREIFYGLFIQNSKSLGNAILETRRHLFRNNEAHPLTYSSLTLYGNPWVVFNAKNNSD